MTLVAFVVASLAMAAGAFVQGGAGFGANLLAAPLVALVAPELVPGPLIVAVALLTYLMTWRERHALDIGLLRWAAAARVPGSIGGALLVAHASGAAIDVSFGVIILVMVAISASGVHVAPTPGVQVGVGLLSGISGTATSVGGPPLALLYQREDGPRFRATLSLLFAVGTVVSVASLAVVGNLGWTDVGRGIALIPAVFVGFAASRVSARFVDAGWLRPVVLALSGASALVVLVRGLL